MAQDFCQDHCWRIDIGLWRCSEKVAWGEVYRADDLTLGQPAALKFLPEEAAKDAALVRRFRGEVRISRKVSHPNVCRQDLTLPLGGGCGFRIRQCIYGVSCWNRWRGLRRVGGTRFCIAPCGSCGSRYPRSRGA